MFWSEISILTTREAADAVGNICIEEGANGIALEDRRDDSILIKAYLPVTDLSNSRVDKIKRRVAGLSLFGLNVGKGTVSLRQIPEEDWAEAWKFHYKPIFVGEDIMVKPTWYEMDTEENRSVIIQMDPGMAFGSGTHFTTYSCLELLQRKIEGGENLVDLGTGSGILAIAAARLGAASVLAIDVDEVAIKVAQRNLELNGVTHKVELRLEDIISALKGIEERASLLCSVDIVIANIIAEVILEICDGASSLLKPGGIFIAAGITRRRKDDVESSMIKAGFSLEDVLMDDEWVTLCGRKV